MNITITLSATPELLSALQTIAGAMSGAKAPTTVNGAAKKSTKAAAATPPETQTEDSDGAQDTATDVQDTTAQATNGTATIEEIRKLVQQKFATGKRELVKTVLSEFGASNVTTLKKEHYSDFFKKVETL